jgi:hypothetical protein
MRATFQHYLRQSQYWSQGMKPHKAGVPTGDGGVVMPQHERDGSYATPSKSREEIAAHIAAGHPSPVSYSARRVTTVTLCPGVTSTTMDPIDVPVHLRRAGAKLPPELGR